MKLQSWVLSVAAAALVVLSVSMTPAHALESRFNRPINEKDLEESWKSSDVDDDEW